MVLKCCVLGCTSIANKLEGLSLHILPQRDTIRYQKWFANFKKLNNQYRICKTGRICSKHFHEEDFNRMKNKKILKNMAIPTIFPKLHCSLRFVKSCFSIS